jgi:predicted GH43/DUF377 family glycosyl hydrolase
MAKKQLFKKRPEPILEAEDIPGEIEVNSVFNSGATSFNGRVLLLLRVEDCEGLSHLRRAISANGITDWEIDKEPTFIASDNYRSEGRNAEDPRVVYLPERECYAITYTDYREEEGPRVSLILTRDFKSFKRVNALDESILPPENKNAALFSECIDGMWWMLHRPMATRTPDIYICRSPDLKHWGDHKLLLMTRGTPYWDGDRIGVGPPPLKTEIGWLLFYHGVKGSIYRVGLALLDLEDPRRVIKRVREHILSPEDGERIGDAMNALFPCGLVVKEIKNQKKIILYYGGADQKLYAAIADLEEVLDYIRVYG